VFQEGSHQLFRSLFEAVAIPAPVIADVAQVNTTGTYENVRSPRLPITGNAADPLGRASEFNGLPNASRRRRAEIT
jgi:hypothetical protein